MLSFSMEDFGVDGHINLEKLVQMCREERENGIRRPINRRALVAGFMDDNSDLFKDLKELRSHIRNCEICQRLVWHTRYKFQYMTPGEAVSALEVNRITEEVRAYKRNNPNKGWDPQTRAMYSWQMEQPSSGPSCRRKGGS